MSSPTSPPAVLTLLGHRIRWQLLQSLALSDLNVQELTAAVKQPQNLVSYHLHKLLEHGIVKEHRSIADGRVIYYNLDLNRLAAIYAQIGYALHPALSYSAPFTPEKPSKKINVLFICTHNSARSQIAEAVLRAESAGAVEVHSAGTDPSQVHPLALKVLEARRIDPSGLHAKDLAQFTNQQFQYIITVCDRAKESCPVATQCESIGASLILPKCRVMSEIDTLPSTMQPVNFNPG
jgi:protein-tyrosine-phosphatase/DNA-binding transcriptional ArsR family regulator